MPKITTVFQRVEKKYICDFNQKESLMEMIRDNIYPDAFGKSTLTSIYLDSPLYTIARESQDTLNYKEKLRLRAYGQPEENGTVFLEIKKKLNGVVYKRRETMTLNQANKYLETREKPRESQIFRELDYAMDYYNNPTPKIAICCEREAFFVNDYPELRITFDSGIRYRRENLTPSYPPEGKYLTEEGISILEFKTDGYLPLWFSHAIDKLKINTVSFSKYCRAYNDCRLTDKNFIKY